MRHFRRDTRAGPIAHGLQALRPVVVAVGDDEPRLVLQLVESAGDRLRDKLIDFLDRVEPVAHVERAKLAAVRRNRRRSRDGLGVDEDPIGGERGVDVAQGVRDALERNTSQRPTAERDVETLPRHVERLGVVNRETDTATLLARQRSP